jgi:hypothetical protein
MGMLSHCVSCGRKLRDAFFCSRCQKAACCWRCLDAHLEQHELTQQEAPDEAESSAPPEETSEPSSLRAQPSLLVP